ncbi:MAG: DsbA family protein [Hyphomicrobiaceae bacterium]
MRRALLNRFGVVAALSLAVSGCTGTTPTLSGMGANPDPVAASGGPNLSPEEVAQSASAAAFNPFADHSSATPGGREVISNPTMAEILAPVAGTLPEIALGSADAPVTVVQYGSLTCPHCKRFHTEVYPALKRDFIDTGKVRYILRDFPIGRQSGQASIAIRCAAPDKYVSLYGKFLDQQSAWVSQEVRVDPIFAVAAQAGLSRADYDACRSNTALVENIKAIKDRGRKLGIIGTPNFFVQDKLVKKALDMAELSGMIDAAARAKTAAAGGGLPPQ